MCFNALLRGGRKGRTSDTLDLVSCWLCGTVVLGEGKVCSAPVPAAQHCRCAPTCCNVWPACEGVINELQLCASCTLCP